MSTPVGRSDLGGTGILRVQPGLAPTRSSVQAVPGRLGLAAAL